MLPLKISLVSNSEIIISLLLPTDYTTGTGNMLQFAAGETSQLITVFVNSDDIPEADEFIAVSLFSPTGGAVVTNGIGSSVEIMIQANDNAAGIFGFAEESRAAILVEGGTASLTVDRTIGQIGKVLIYWNITGINNDIANDFAAISGTLLFSDVRLRVPCVVASFHYILCRVRVKLLLY